MAIEGPGRAGVPSLTSLPRYRGHSRSGDGLDADRVREAFDAFRRHAAQLQAQLRVLQAAGRSAGRVEPTGHAVRMDALHLIRAAAEFADTIERDAQNASAAQLGKTEEEVRRRQNELQEREAEVERYRQESERQRAEMLNAARNEARELLAKAHADATRELQEAEARGQPPARAVAPPGDRAHERRPRRGRADARVGARTGVRPFSPAPSTAPSSCSPPPASARTRSRRSRARSSARPSSAGEAARPQPPAAASPARAVDAARRRRPEPPAQPTRRRRRPSRHRRRRRSGSRLRRPSPRPTRRGRGASEPRAVGFRNAARLRAQNIRRGRVPRRRAVVAAALGASAWTIIGAAPSATCCLRLRGRPLDARARRRRAAPACGFPPANVRVQTLRARSRPRPPARAPEEAVVVVQPPVPVVPVVEPCRCRTRLQQPAAAGAGSRPRARPRDHARAGAGAGARSREPEPEPDPSPSRSPSRAGARAGRRAPAAGRPRAGAGARPGAGTARAGAGAADRRADRRQRDAAPVEPLGSRAPDARERRDGRRAGRGASFLLMYLREFADADGLLPIDFDGLVRDSFGELVGSPVTEIAGLRAAALAARRARRDRRRARRHAHHVKTSAPPPAAGGQWYTALAAPYTPSKATHEERLRRRDRPEDGRRRAPGAAVRRQALRRVQGKQVLTQVIDRGHTVPGPRVRPHAGAREAARSAGHADDPVALRPVTR